MLRRPYFQNATMLFLDELEAIRLGDLEGLSQEEAAAKMEISRSTFARLINEAHRKIADALLSSSLFSLKRETTGRGEKNFQMRGMRARMGNGIRGRMSG